VTAAPLLELVPDWEDFLRLSSQDELKLLQRHERSGRPLGNEGFIQQMEQSLGRILRPGKPGPRKKKKV